MATRSKLPKLLELPDEELLPIPREHENNQALQACLSQPKAVLKSLVRLERQICKRFEIQPVWEKCVCSCPAPAHNPNTCEKYRTGEVKYPSLLYFGGERELLRALQRQDYAVAIFISTNSAMSYCDVTIDGSRARSFNGIPEALMLAVALRFGFRVSSKLRAFLMYRQDR